MTAAPVWYPRARQWIRLSVSVLLWIAICPVFALNHVHVQISYPDQWDLYVYDYAVGRLAPETTVLPVAAAARQLIPEDTRYTEFLGEAGDPIWILSQDHQPGLIFMGIGTSRIALHRFELNELFLELHRLEGPGHFALFTVDSLGTPQVLMNSRDGIDPARDRVRVPAISAHLHMNWAFSTPGRYRIGLAATAILAAPSTLTTSEVVHYQFEVNAMPPRLELRKADTGYKLVAYAERGWQCWLESAAGLSGPWSTRGDPWTGSDLGSVITFESYSTDEFFRLVVRPPPHEL